MSWTVIQFLIDIFLHRKFGKKQKKHSAKLGFISVSVVAGLKSLNLNKAYVIIYSSLNVI